MVKARIGLKLSKQMEFVMFLLQMVVEVVI